MTNIAQSPFDDIMSALKNQAKREVYAEIMAKISHETPNFEVKRKRKPQQIRATSNIGGQKNTKTFIIRHKIEEILRSYGVGKMIRQKPLIHNMMRETGLKSSANVYKVLKLMEMKKYISRESRGEDAWIKVEKLPVLR